MLAVLVVAMDQLQLQPPTELHHTDFQRMVEQLLFQAVAHTPSAVSLPILILLWLMVVRV